jgi:hypothetical protein
MTSTRHQLLRRVPPPAVRVLEMGSTCPGALLYDARRLFDAQDARATGEGCGSCVGVVGQLSVGARACRWLATGTGKMYA